MVYHILRRLTPFALGLGLRMAMGAYQRSRRPAKAVRLTSLRAHFPFLTTGLSRLILPDRTRAVDRWISDSGGEAEAPTCNKLPVPVRRERLTWHARRSRIARSVTLASRSMQASGQSHLRLSITRVGTGWVAGR